MNVRELALEDLKKSGLDEGTIEEAGFVLAPSPRVLDEYKIVHFDKKSREFLFTPLWLLPYPSATLERDSKFCRVKVINAKDGGKYRQPSKSVVSSPVHLYFPPGEYEKAKKAKTSILLVEGEKKALKVWQELKNTTLFDSHAVIGIAGVENWRAPEWEKIRLHGREVIIFFDADKFINPLVRIAELKLFGFLTNRGAYVKSAEWNANIGKGIDDYLVEVADPVNALKSLIENASATQYVYKRELEDFHSAKNFARECIQNFERARRILKELGWKERSITRLYLQAKEEWQQELLERNREEIERIFGVEIEEIPKGFYVERGFVYTKNGAPLFPLFIPVSKLINEEGEEIGIKIKFADKTEFILPALNNSYDFSPLKKKLGITSEDTQKGMQKWMERYKLFNPLNVEEYSNSTGWAGDKYYIEQLTPSKMLLHGKDNGFSSSGDKEAELELMKNIFNIKSPLLFGYLVGFSAPLVHITGSNNLIVSLQGLSGTGKTTAGKIALSVYGDPEKLYLTANATRVALELLLSQRKDIPVLLDEITTEKDKLIEELIMDFYHGKGRSRANKSVLLRETHTYRGALILTSETGLEKIISAKDTATRGILRRSLIVEFLDNAVPEDILALVNQKIKENYGNLIADWIEYIKENKEEIKEGFLSLLNTLEGKHREQTALLIITAQYLKR